MKIDIRAARTTDAPQIADFNRQLAAESEGLNLEEARINAGVDALLRDASKGRYWLAEADGKAVGQIMVTYEWSDWRNATIWWIQSVYVHPDYRRRGVFSTLYRTVEQAARDSGDACGLRLYVEENNTRAQATYRALGMHGGTYLVMESMF